MPPPITPITPHGDLLLRLLCNSTLHATYLVSSAILRIASPLLLEVLGTGPSSLVSPKSERLPGARFDKLICPRESYAALPSYTVSFKGVVDEGVFQDLLKILHHDPPPTYTTTSTGIVTGTKAYTLLQLVDAAAIAEGLRIERAVCVHVRPWIGIWKSNGSPMGELAEDAVIFVGKIFNCDVDLGKQTERLVLSAMLNSAGELRFWRDGKMIVATRRTPKAVIDKILAARSSRITTLRETFNTLYSTYLTASPPGTLCILSTSTASTTITPYTYPSPLISSHQKHQCHFLQLGSLAFTESRLKLRSDTFWKQSLEEIGKAFREIEDSVACSDGSGGGEKKDEGEMRRHKVCFWARGLVEEWKKVVRGVEALTFKDFEEGGKKSEGARTGL